MTDVVVVGVDGSEDSLRALCWAAKEARIRGARLRLVRAWSYADQPEGGFDPSYDEEAARRMLDESVSRLGTDSTGLEIERRVVCDLPARALLDAAADADLLVVGSRGLGGFQGLLLGSVSQQVVHHAPCPIVIVPGAERSEAGS